ncbi:oligopeptide ABC transporter substrate-binding protein [Peribacillus cavernae]|uniref:Oligopeptide ABC transporter substrate-binding protein n=1 Tax=Peribacillus cavernae TaxID=1674310 RepID=A0A3S0UF92_9BACI|nr:oligopeptide ABC transporter substrate-binding protein [Peribacillus cavernae]MDQ0217341.1 peptide/nickel transport system substrate-binding protein [Peribacillus cavernae]RUQ30206.1 oligopeptide ABC transporter substrate-binding protein [Peribacillus cavernae]
MRLKRYSKVWSALAISAILLSACSNDASSTKKPHTTRKMAEQMDTKEFSHKTNNDQPDVADGSLTYGLVSNTPFEGILNKAFYEGEPDNKVISIFDEGLLGTDENFIYDQSGAATYGMSEDKKTITIKIKENVNWHNGDPVTATDLLYAYEVIGSPQYKGARYYTPMDTVVGMDKYHAGKAKKISGIKVVDDKTISISFKEANPSLLTGLWTAPLPKKYLAGVPIGKMDAAYQIRKKPIGFGPYKVKKIVQGESVEYERNNDYWKGRPKLKSIILKVINPQIATASLKKGDIDFADITADQYEQAVSLTNIEVLGGIDLAYDYIGFKLGHWDAKKGENVMDNPKFRDKRLRQAMAYAIDTKLVGEKLYKGLRFPANTVLPPSFPKYYAGDVKGYSMDQNKAERLLDEAGYIDTDNDGLREDLNGKQFTIHFAAMSGSDTLEPLIQYYIQQWREVGLDVQMLEGRLHEFNSFYNRIEKDDKQIDMYAAAWGTGSDPDQSGLWVKKAMFNYTRWVNEKSDRLLKAGISLEAFDETYRKEIYKLWQAHISEEVPLIPTFFRYHLLGVNGRVKGVTLYGGEVADWYHVSVTEEQPVK